MKIILFFRSWYCISNCYRACSPLTCNFVWELEVWKCTKPIFSLKNHWKYRISKFYLEISVICVQKLICIYSVVYWSRSRVIILFHDNLVTCFINLPLKLSCWKQIHTQAWWLLFKPQQPDSFPHRVFYIFPHPSSVNCIFRALSPYAVPQKKEKWWSLIFKLFLKLQIHNGVYICVCFYIYTHRWTCFSIIFRSDTKSIKELKIFNLYRAEHSNICVTFSYPHVNQSDSVMLNSKLNQEDKNKKRIKSQCTSLAQSIIILSRLSQLLTAPLHCGCTCGCSTCPGSSHIQRQPWQPSEQLRWGALVVVK